MKIAHINKIKLLAIMLIVFTPLLVFSQDSLIKFNGYSYRAIDRFNQPVKMGIAKIEITNLSNGNKFIANGNISKSKIIATSIDNKPIVNKEAKIVYLDKNNSLINIFIRSEFDKKINIFIADLNGRKISNVEKQIPSGISNVSMTTNGIDDGFYSIIMSDELNILTANSFIVCNGISYLNETINNSLDQKNSLSESSGYQFVAYSDSFYKPDTVVVETLDDISTIDFYFKDKAEFIFRSGNIKIDSLGVEIDEIATRFNFNTNVPDTTYKTYNENMTIDVDLRVRVDNLPGNISCDQQVNYSSLVYFCDAFFYTDVTKNFVRNSVVIDINSSEQVLYIFDLESNLYGFSNLGHSLNGFQRFKPKLSIPYKIDEETGIITCSEIIDSKDIGFTYYLNSISEDMNFENPIILSSKERKSLSLGATQNKVKFELELVP